MPPPKMTVSEWSDSNRHLSPESSAEPGRWFTARAEYQRSIMDALCDPLIDTIVMMSSAQVGKTEILNNICGYFIDQDPSPILVVQPTVDMGSAWSKDRLAPMLRDTPCLRGKVQDPRSRDSGNTTLHKIFPGGHITITGSNSAAGLASRPIRVVLADELDRWPASAGTEGDPLKLAFKRATTFWNRKKVVVSTPTVKGFSRIEDMFNESDKRRYWVPCPECSTFQTMKWSQVQWPKDKPEDALYYCEACGCEITDADKLAMVRNGEWRAEGESRGVAGFHLNELYSPWRSFADVACDFVEAKKNPETLRVWVNTSLGETWEEAGETVDASPLFHRRENLSVVPMQVGILTSGIDVQADRLEVSVIGWGVDEEAWVLSHTMLLGDPAKQEVWRDLDVFLGKRYPHASGRELSVKISCLDMGYQTAEVVSYTRSRWPKVIAVKGQPTEGRLLTKIVGVGHAKRIDVGVHTAKDAIYARLKIAEEGKGYVHFSNTLDSEYFAQLTAEKIATKFVKGRPFREFVKIRPRNEALDCFVYALAALHANPAVVPSLDRIVQAVQPVVEKVPEVVQHQALYRPKPAKKSFATSWR